jgi:hypothetical protein
MNLRGVAKRIAKVANSRGRRCGPHNTSGQGCRCTTDRGHQYSRLHVGFFFSRRRRHSAAAGCASRMVGLFKEKVADAVMASNARSTFWRRSTVATALLRRPARSGRSGTGTGRRATPQPILTTRRSTRPGRASSNLWRVPGRSRATSSPLRVRSAPETSVLRQLLRQYDLGLYELQDHPVLCLNPLVLRLCSAAPAFRRQSHSTLPGYRWARKYDQPSHLHCTEYRLRTEQFGPSLFLGRP